MLGAINDEIKKILIMSAIGLLGGAVRVCSYHRATNLKIVVSSLMVSFFASGMTAMFLHDYIEDPITLAAICGMGGYFGQITLVLIAREISKRTGIDLNVGGLDK